ncbi:MAG TPA: hypothetical protein VIP11_06560 [Gemmatimonadaceae bacterium]
MDLARTRAALLGCLGLTIIAFALLYVTLQRMRRTFVQRERITAQQTVPCIRDPERIRPVLVGDTARLSVGTMENGECTPREQTGFRWSSADSTFVDVRPDGLMRGKSPGAFTAIAHRADSTITTRGFVMPPEWVAKIAPENIKLRVGDSVTIVMHAVDRGGAPMPVVPFSIFTPEFFDGAARRKPIVNKPAWQDATEPIVVTAVDTGTTTLVGRMGIQQVTAHLTVMPRK